MGVYIVLGVMIFCQCLFFLLCLMCLGELKEHVGQAVSILIDVVSGEKHRLKTRNYELEMKLEDFKKQLDQITKNGQSRSFR